MRGFLVLAARILVSGALLSGAPRRKFCRDQSRLSESSPAWILGWMGLSVLVTVVQIFFWRLEVAGDFRSLRGSVACNVSLQVQHDRNFLQPNASVNHRRRRP